MLARTALFLLIATSSTQAAPFEHLKADLAACLRFELDSAASQRSAPATARAAFALRRCEDEASRLERADGRRLRADGGLSPSTRAVIQDVLARGARSGYTNARF